EPHLKMPENLDKRYFILFAEAQTSGGLLATVRPDQVEALVNALKDHGDTETTIIGRVEKLDDPTVFLEIE
ncbi:MAG: hypothetical protein K8S15_03655, partial [Candidatus Aegiribacteria sp.]|nr:hypothetical protein [Candidatus Aegiribacteria sp.]